MLTWQFSLLLLAAQVIITRYSDNDLQLWCKKSVFGTELLRRPLSEQEQEFMAAIKEIA